MDDNFVIPSWLTQSPNANFKDVISNNFSLKIGQVIKVNYPTDKLKQLQTDVTYDVLIEDYYESKKHNILNGCVILDKFGGVADFISYTLRQNDGDILKEIKNITPQKVLGSYVLVLYVHGKSNQPIIIGGIKNPLTKLNTQRSFPKETDGHNLKFSFNGIDINIDKDGQLTLSQNGANDASGALLSSVDKNSVGSFIKIDKKGDVLISANATKDKDKPDNYLNLKKDGTIIITNGAKQVLTMDKNGGNITIFGDNVHLGDKNSLDFVALSQKVDQNFSTLVNQLLSHMHPTSAPGAPTGPPMPPGFSSPPSVAGKHVKGS